MPTSIISLFRIQLSIDCRDDFKDLILGAFLSSISANLEDLVVGQPEFDQFLLLDKTLRIFIRKDNIAFMIFIEYPWNIHS